jgi:hypothetical protein
MMYPYNSHVSHRRDDQETHEGNTIDGVDRYGLASYVR